MNLEGSSCDLITVLSRNLPGGIEENQKKLSHAQIRTEHLPNTVIILELRRYTSLLGVCAFYNI